MRKKTILLILIGFILYFSTAHSQSGELSITQTNNGSVIDVNVFLKNTRSSAWNLGFASLVFNYNHAAMNNPVELTEGRWDNDSNSQYADQTIATYSGGAAESIEIGLNSLPSDGTSVPTALTLVGTIRFNILNNSQYHNIIWNTGFSAVLDNNGNDLSNSMVYIDPLNEPLPIELASFVSTVLKNDVVLNWTTTQEQNNSRFNIERNKIQNNIGSYDWQEAGFVNGAGNSNGPKSYSFTDKNLQSGKYNYRLKQIDYNGAYKYYELQNEVVVNLPSKFELAQNYPNPFNPVTVIRFDVPRISNIKLVIYDNTGREIERLVDDVLMPGIYEYKWNATNFASGIYFYKLQADGFENIKSMALVK